MSQLQKLADRAAAADKPKKKKQKKQYSAAAAANTTTATKRSSSGKNNARSGRQQQQDLFAGLEGLVPIDRAAEATLFKSSARGSTAGSEHGGGSIAGSEHGGGEVDETGAWLAKVAVALGASRDGSRAGGIDGYAASSISGRSGARQKRSSNQTSPCASRSMSPPPPRFQGGMAAAAAASNAELKSDRSGNSTPKPFAAGIASDFPRPSLATLPPEMLAPRSASPSSSASKDCLSSLADIACGVRHGTRVFRVDDKKRLVGEVSRHSSSALMNRRICMFLFLDYASRVLGSN